MLYQNYSFEQSQNQIFYVLKELQIAKPSAKLRNRYQEADKDIDHRTNGYGTEDTETIKSKVTNWIASQSRYIKGLFQNLCWEN